MTHSRTKLSDPTKEVTIICKYSTGFILLIMLVVPTNWAHERAGCGAMLNVANLHQADLNGADLMGAKLLYAVFCNTTMPDGSINNSNCKRQVQSENDEVLSGVADKKKLLATNECSGCDLNGVNLFGANLSEANLFKADMSMPT
jgi:uncharacterized protein YjbI with pentapeptide repeats